MNKVAFANKTEIEAVARDVVVDTLRRIGVTAEMVTPEASFLIDLGADSLDLVELVMAIEEAFDIEIDDETAEKLANFGAVVEYLERVV